MYPVIRFLAISLKAMRAPKQSFETVGTCSFIARPWDMDMFLEMNNGRHLTLYDLGRFDLAIKAGLGRVLKDNGWGLVVAGGSVRFRRRIHVFNRVTMKTRLVAVDQRWIYLHQAMYVRGEPCSAVLLRTGVTEKGRAIDTDRVKAALDLTFDLTPPPWVQKWIDADHGREWPPMFDDMPSAPTDVA